MESRTPRNTVVVVDDHAPTREAYAVLLQDGGFRVLAVAHGGEAILLILRHSPDVVLLDVGMPVFDSPDTAACLRAYPPTAGARILGITGCGCETERNRMRALCDDLILKPCTPELVESRVRALARLAA